MVSGTTAEFESNLENLGQHNFDSGYARRPTNLPPGMVASAWPGAGYASFGGGITGAYQELGEIYDFIREHEITGLATVAGDAHSFWAGLSAKSLPPKPFDPVGVAFVVGSISAPGMVEAMEHQLHKDAPLRALFLGQGPGDNRPQPTVNMLVRHGVRSCLEYAKSGDVQKARQLSNRDLSPHLSFVDMAGHGYSVVHAAADRLETDFTACRVPSFAMLKTSRMADRFSIGFATLQGSGASTNVRISSRR